MGILHISPKVVYTFSICMLGNHKGLPLRQEHPKKGRGNPLWLPNVEKCKLTNEGCHILNA